MKKNKIYLFSLVLFSLVACNDYLDLKPKNVISLESIDDVKVMMSSYFYGISGTNNAWQREAAQLDGQSIYFPYNLDVTTSMMFYGDNIKMDKVPELWQAWSYYEDEYREAVKWQGFEFSNKLWSEIYHNIGYFNVVLDGLKGLDEASDKYKEVYCEAKLLRTLMFFNILKFYSPYLNDKYGIPVNISSTIIEGTERPTQTEVYKFLLDELNSIKKMDFSATSWNVFYSKRKLSALFSQVYWFKAESAAKAEDDWKNAVDYANEVLSGKTLANTSSKLKNIFSGENKDVILDNPYALLIIANGRATKNNGQAPFGSGTSRLQPTDEFASLYAENDIRKEAFYTEEMGINKYSFSFFGASNVVPLWRIAEFQLIVAEAYARMGDNANAAKYLNDFKKSRIPDYTSYPNNDLLDEILRERRKEFCYEFGSRWIDLKRINKGFKRVGVAEDNEATEFILENDDYRFALPIPQDLELGLNGSMEQNPGWPL